MPQNISYLTNPPLVTCFFTELQKNTPSSKLVHIYSKPTRRGAFPLSRNLTDWVQLLFPQMGGIFSIPFLQKGPSPLSFLSRVPRHQGHQGQKYIPHCASPAFPRVFPAQRGGGGGAMALVRSLRRVALAGQACWADRWVLGVTIQAGGLFLYS